MTFRNPRIWHTVKRLFVLWLLFLLLGSWSPIRKHVRNWTTEGRLQAYAPKTEDAIVKIKDVKISRCYSWYHSCDKIWDYDLNNELVTWIRVDPDKNLDISLERGFWYHSYVYWQPSYDSVDSGPVVVDLAWSKQGVPLGLLNERYNRIRNNEIDGYDNRDYNFFVKQDRGSQQADPRPLRWSAKFGNHLEDWFWRGDGIWCKYGSRSDGLLEIKAFVGEDFIESRPLWKEMVHCLERDGYSRPISFSFLKPGLGRGGSEIYGTILKPEIVMNRSDLKVLQVTDMHFGRNVISDPRNETPDTLFRYDYPNVQFLNTVIRNERPDLVVITGHMFKDFDNTMDYEVQILKIVSPIIKNGIPFVIAWGESSQTNEYKAAMLTFIKSLPFCLNKFDAKNSTNLMLPILSKSSSDGLFKQIGSIYAFDSNVTESYNFLKKFPPSANTEFNLAFQHLPLHEYRPQGSFALIGSYEEKKSLKDLQPTKDFRNLLGLNRFKALSCGYEHGNDCCILSDGEKQSLVENMWLCYGGISGYDPVFHSKVRLFKIDAKKNEITSWKRSISDTSHVSDYQYIWSETTD